jgi:hypothetical protein
VVLQLHNRQRSSWRRWPAKVKHEALLIAILLALLVGIGYMALVWW